MMRFFLDSSSQKYAPSGEPADEGGLRGIGKKQNHNNGLLAPIKRICPVNYRQSHHVHRRPGLLLQHVY